VFREESPLARVLQKLILCKQHKPTRKDPYVILDNHISDHRLGGGLLGIRGSGGDSDGNRAGAICNFSGFVFGVFDFKSSEEVKRH
jgi:hypothetical protein